MCVVALWLVFSCVLSIISAEIHEIQRDIKPPGQGALVFIPCSTTLVCGHARKSPLGRLWDSQGLPVAPANPVCCSKVFCSLCHIPPRRFKLCAGVRGSRGRGCAGGAGRGVGMRRFPPQGHGDSDGSGGEAPESRSCAGAASPVLLLVCNFSKYRPSNLFPESGENSGISHRD